MRDVVPMADDSDLEPQPVRWRHRLHRFAETGFNGVRVADDVASMLGALGLEMHRGIGGIVANLRVGNGSGAVRLRADTDALAITEDGSQPSARLEAARLPIGVRCFAEVASVSLPR